MRVVVGLLISFITLFADVQIVNDKVVRFAFEGVSFKNEALSQITTKPLLKCSPKLQGVYEVSGANEVTLYALKALPKSTHYSCATAPINKKKHVVTFDTPAFAFEGHHYNNRVVRLKFNDALDSKYLKKHIHVTRTLNLTQTPIKFDIKTQGDVAILSLKDVKAKDALSVKLDSTIINKKGVKLGKAYRFALDKTPKEEVKLDKTRVSMNFFDAPRFVSTEDGHFAIRIYLPSYFYGEPIKPFLDVEGVKNISVSSPQYLYYGEREKENLHENSEYYVDIYGDFEAQSQYALTIKKGLKDSYRFELKEDKHYTLKSGDAKSAINFVDKDKYYLSTKGEIAFESINTSEAKVIIERVLERNYDYFSTFKGADSDYIEDITEVVATRSLKLQNSPNRFVKQKIDLKLLDQPYGIYKVSFVVGDTYFSKVIYFSDIAISTRMSNHEAFMLVSHLSDTTPIKGASVKLIGRKNDVIGECVSDDNGSCLIQAQNILDYTPTAVIASTPNDKNFLYLYNALNGVSKYQSVMQKYQAFIYAQSKLVRPDNSLEAMVVLKDKNFMSAKSLPVRIEIRDPEFSEVFNRSFESNANGVFDFHLDIPAFYKTGRYSIEAYLGDSMIGRSNFYLEEFLPQQLESHIETQKQRYSTKETLIAKLSARYLFGALAKNIKGDVRLSAVSKRYESTKYPAFRFIDTFEAKENLFYIDTTKDIVLNEQGQTEVIFDLHLKNTPPSILKGQLSFNVLDDGKNVASYKEFTLYPYEKMVGLRIFNERVEEGEALQAKAILIDPMTQELSKRELMATIKRIDWNYHYDYANGHYRWDKEVRVVDSFRVEGAFERNVAQSGEYLLEVQDMVGLHKASMSFSVRGWGYSALKPTDELDKNQVSFEDRAYKMGDVLKVDVKSPIMQGRLLALLSVNNRVKKYTFFDINSSKASFDMVLDFNLRQGAYLHTYIYRDTNTSAELIPYRAFSEDFILSDRSDRDMNITIDAPKQVKSKQTVRIEVGNLEPNASVVISVVDNGILQILGQKPPKLFAFFNKKPLSKFGVYDFYNQVMRYAHEGKLLAFGGDDEEALMKQRKHLSPDRLEFKPFVHWSGVLSEQNGTVSTTLNTQSFNGKATIVALVLTQDRVGVSSQEIVVKDDVVIKPSYPRFLLKGDNINIPLRLFNTTQKDKNISIAIESGANIALDVSDKVELALTPESSKVLNFNIKALNLGKSDVNISVEDGNHTYTHTITLPITPASSLATKVFSSETNKVKTLKLDEYLGAELDFTLSNSYLAQFKDDLYYIIAYPYGCLEQTTSRTLAMMHLDRFLNAQNVEEAQLLKDRDSLIEQAIEKLSAMQAPSGDFSYWSDGKYVDLFSSLYASDILLELSKSSKVPQNVQQGIYKALKSVLKQNNFYNGKKATASQKLYAGYLLSRENQLSDDIANALYDSKKYKTSLSNYYKMLYIMSKVNFEAMGAIQNEIRALSVESYRFKTLEIAKALYIHLQLFGKDEGAKKLFELLVANKDTLYSTKLKAFVIRALVHYYEDMTLKNNIDALVQVNDKTYWFSKEGYIHGKLLKPNIYIKSPSLVSYNASLSYYKPLPTKHKLGKKSLNIYREFIDKKGTKVDINALKVGDIIYSKVSFNASKYLENVVVNQRIPACFEIINKRLSKEPMPFKDKRYMLDFEDIRDDRVLSFMRVNKKLSTFYTALRVTHSGGCRLPAIFTEMMYDNRVFDYDKEVQSFVVKP